MAAGSANASIAFNPMIKALGRSWGRFRVRVQVRLSTCYTCFVGCRRGTMDVTTLGNGLTGRHRIFTRQVISGSVKQRALNQENRIIRWAVVTVMDTIIGASMLASGVIVISFNWVTSTSS